jgi:hypothetical protein
VAEQIKRIIETAKSQGYDIGAKALTDALNLLVESGLFPQTLTPEQPPLPEIEDIREFLKAARTGPYLSEERVAAIISGKHLTHNQENYVDKLRRDLTKNNREALAHLLLPTHPWNALLRDNVRTVSELKQTVSSGNLTVIYEIGPISGEIIRERLAEFDALMDQAKLNGLP